MLRHPLPPRWLRHPNQQPIESSPKNEVILFKCSYPGTVGGIAFKHYKTSREDQTLATRWRWWLAGTGKDGTVVSTVLWTHYDKLCSRLGPSFPLMAKGNSSLAMEQMSLQHKSQIRELDKESTLLQMRGFKSSKTIYVRRYLTNFLFHISTAHLHEPSSHKVAKNFRSVLLLHPKLNTCQGFN